MTYFTSWDANVFLCLVTLGVPEDVVKIAVKISKKTHEDFTLREAFSYWNTNSPRLVRWRLTQPLERRGVSLRFQISELLDYTQTRINVYNRRLKNTKEFKTEWRLRSIEERKKKVADWCYFGSDKEQDRHQIRFNKPIHMPFVRSMAIAETESKLLKERKEYTKNLWSSWEAGASSYYFVGSGRRDYVRKWYEGIHPGRFFLFYKENEIIKERNRGVPKGPCEDGYKYPKIPIFDWGPYEQLIEDLRCIDGPGLGESGGSKVEHIDDLFLQ